MNYVTCQECKATHLVDEVDFDGGLSFIVVSVLDFREHTPRRKELINGTYVIVHCPKCEE